MLDPSEIRSRLAGVKIAKVCRDTALPYFTVYRFANGTVQNPSYATVKALSDYLTGANA